MSELLRMSRRELTRLEIMQRLRDKRLTQVEAGEVEDVVGAAVLADVAQIVDRADCIMVSPGVTREETKRLGFRYAATAEDALRMAFERQGKASRVAVLRHGGHVLPLIAGEAS